MILKGINKIGDAYTPIPKLSAKTVIKLAWELTHSSMEQNGSETALCIKTVSA